MQDDARLADIRATIERLEPEIIAFRRRLHQVPERGFCEYQTSSILRSALRAAGWDVLSGVEASDTSAALFVPPETEAAFSAAAAELGPAEVEGLEGGRTALVAVRRFGPGPVVAFRFDMDALPITESVDASHPPAREGFASRNPGWMHACGHDAHMAIGLGLAKVLGEHASQFTGTIKLLFQPAEEGTPGGARAMVAKGLVDDVDLLLCTHVGLSALEIGQVAISEFLGTSKYRVVFHGRPAHVVQAPEAGANALLAAAQAALQLHAITPHSGGWFNVNVGTLRAGTEQGVTPDRAEITFGLWATSAEVQEHVNARALGIISSVADLYRVESVVELIGEAPTLPADHELVRRISSSIDTSSSGGREIDTVFTKAGEDGTVFIQRVRDHGGRAEFLLVGTPVGTGHHTPGFDVDERALSQGVELLASIALNASRILVSSE
jgi:aminobenzoyl-glutamate utilization protein A